jgi:4-coumarate--CoA ligase
MTETGPVGTMTPMNDEVLGSCGVLLPNTEAKVVDLHTGKALGPNEKGEMCLRGPQVLIKKEAVF